LSPCTETVSFLFVLKWVLATSVENSFVRNAYYDLQKSGTATDPEKVNLQGKHIKCWKY